MKILGSVLVIFASIISSYFYEKRLKDDIKNSEALCDFIRYIKSKIEYFSASIDEILSSYPTQNELLKNCIKQRKVCNFSFLESDTENDINIFFAKLGKGFKKEQLALCEYTLRELEKAKEKKENEFAKKSKIFHSLSLFFGIGCVILLV